MKGGKDVVAKYSRAARVEGASKSSLRGAYLKALRGVTYWHLVSAVEATSPDFKRQPNEKKKGIDDYKRE